MKLVTISGITKLPSVDIPPQGVSIGRELDNDVVTADEQASRYHAKITQDEGVWRLHDLKSRNGVYVNNKRVEGSAPLSLNDDVRIGRTVLRVTDDSLPGQGLPQEGVVPSPGSDTSNGLGTPKPTDAKGKRIRLLLVGVITLVVVIAAAYLFLFLTGQLNPPPPKPAGPAEVLKSTDLEVYYEKYESSGDNVFRYELTLSKGNLHAIVDDVKNQRHSNEPPTRIADDDLEQLAKELLTPDFLALGPVAPMPSNKLVKRVRLMVRKGRVGNYVVLKNIEIPPRAYTTAAACLERFATDKLHLIDVPLDQRLKMANERFQEARRLDLERTSLPSNLWKAIQSYDTVLLLLEGIQDPPQIYQDASRFRAEGWHDLVDTVRKTEGDAQILENTGKLADARAQYQRIIDMVPDTTNESYKHAHEKVIGLGMRITEANKRKR